MADDRTKRAPQDPVRINMDDEHEVQYWTRELGVDKDQLAQVIAKVGNLAAAVRRELRK